MKNSMKFDLKDITIGDIKVGEVHLEVSIDMPDEMAVKAMEALSKASESIMGALTQSNQSEPAN